MVSNIYIYDFSRRYDRDGKASVSMGTVGNGSGLYTYNDFNQLTEAFENSKITSYTYDANGLRKSKTIDDVTTNHIWDGSNIVAETNSAGAVTSKYYRGTQLIAREQDGSKQYYAHNAHGDVTALIDSAGSITKTYTYDAFGVEENIDENDTNPFRYCGEYYDAEINSIYLRARYYSPSIGRFKTEDPIKDGLNWYVYCGGNPVMFMDSSGLDHYFLYGNDRESSVKTFTESLQNKNPDIPVHAIRIDTPEDFYNAWNNMGIVDGKEVSIDTVIIELHSTPTDFQIVSSSGDIDITKLEKKQIDTLVLLSCNSGNIDWDNNIATSMARTQDIKCIIAPDGFGVRDYDNNNLIVYSQLYWPKGPIRNREWTYAVNGRTHGYGYVLYQMLDERLFITPGLSANGREGAFSSIADLVNRGKLASFMNQSYYQLRGTSSTMTISELMNRVVGLE